MRAGLPTFVFVVTAALAAALPATATAQSVTSPQQVFGQQQRGESQAGSPESAQGNQQQGAGQQGQGGDSADGSAGPDARWQNPRWGPGKGSSKQKRPPEALPPFGFNLFEGGFRGTMADDLNPNYKVKPGDQVTLRVWGAVEMDQVLTVDAKGNLFIPRIGPLQVQGMNASQLDNRVRQKIREVYPEDVRIYTNLQGVQPVSVFVTGYVNKPGRYAGTPSDSILYFLDQADGIDNELGSYREIRVRRDGQVIATADLYDFLLDGDLPRPQFRDGDTIVVAERGPGIAVTGDVERGYRYELAGDGLRGQAIIDLARLDAGVSHVLVRGSRTDGPFARYYTLEEFGEAQLRSGDEVRFSADRRSDIIVVELEGSYYGPSRYALPRDAHLHELLDAISVPREMTAVESVSIKRESVAERQQEALDENLRRLQQTYLSASSQTDEEASIRVKEAKLIQQFVEQAKQIEPSGRLVVARGDEIRNLRLRDGDVITIPEKSESVLISGEVMVPQAIVHDTGRDARDYIDAAGGFTNRANTERILVVRQNGAVRDASEVSVRAGDEILVLPAVPSKNLQLAKTISQIIFQIAVSTGTVVNLF